MTHEYPPNRAFDSVSISRVSALRDYGLTQRQREFLDGKRCLDAFFG